MPFPKLAPENAKEFPPEESPDFNLRYKADPIKALETCKRRFQKNRWALYELLATIYAVSWRIIDDEDAQAEFFKSDYWASRRRWQVRRERDLFRLVAEYVTEASEKNELTQASKIGKVLWYLYEDKVHPNLAASTIHVSGGIEKMSRHGISRPVMLHPLDAGDGMTVKGEKIHYSDDEDQDEDLPQDYDPNDWKDVVVEFENIEMLKEYVRTVGEVGDLDKKVTISATYGMFERLVLTFIIESVTAVPATRKKKTLLESS